MTAATLPLSAMEDRWRIARLIATPVIKHFESCHLKSYIFKKETWATIGWGKAIPLSQHPKTITQAEADRLFEETLLVKQRALQKEIPAAVLDKLSVGQLAGILSFRYNVKDSTWLDPRSNTRKELVKGNIKGFIAWHAKWINGEAGPLNGLKRRRRVERELLNGANLQAITAANWYQGLPEYR